MRGSFCASRLRSRHFRGTYEGKSRGITWLAQHAFADVHANLERGIGTLLATLTGGLITFGFVLLKARNERKETEIASGTRTLFTLIEMWNVTKQHQKEVVDPYRDRHDAWLNLHVGPPLNPELAFNMNDLTFLMQKAPKVLMSVLLEGHRYRLATYLVEEHRRLTTGIAWPRLEAAGMRVGGPPRPNDEVQQIIGPAAVKQLQVITTAIITNFDENVQSLRGAFVSLRGELIRLFPKRRFVNFNFDPQLQPTASAPQQRQPYYYPFGPGQRGPG